MKQAIKSFYEKLKSLSASLFKRKSAESLNWFFAQIKKDKSAFPKNSFKIVKNIPPIGILCHFIYDPKTKDKLPYWDKFPLVIPFNFTNESFIGINLHYLPIPIRAKLLDGLMNIKHKSATDKAYIQLSYSALQALARQKILNHCIKRYLLSHVKSDIIMIDFDQWENVVYLPTQQFQKASAAKVWGDLQ